MEIFHWSDIISWYIYNTWIWMFNVAKSFNQNMLFMSNKVGEIVGKYSYFSVSSFKENKQKAHIKLCASQRNCVQK